MLAGNTKGFPLADEFLSENTYHSFEWQPQLRDSKTESRLYVAVVCSPYPAKYPLGLGNSIIGLIIGFL